MRTWTQSITNHNEYLHIAHLNIRSLRKNFNELQIFVNNCTEEIGILLLTEVNIKENELALYHIKGYNIFANTRENKRGGGVLIYVKEYLMFNASKTLTSSLEGLHGKLTADHSTINIIAVYRPPKTNKLLFVDEIEQIIKRIPASEQILMLGDVNINLLGLGENQQVSKYKECLCGLGLQCVIPDTEVTREAIVAGVREVSCIDHIWVRARQLRDYHSFVVECFMSDHHVVGVSVPFDVTQPCNDSKNSDTRYVINNKLVFKQVTDYDWSQLLLIDCPTTVYCKLYNVFDNIYKNSKILVPNNKKRVTQPWIDRTLNEMLLRRDWLYRDWKEAPKNNTKRLHYTRFRNKVNKLIFKARNRFRQEEIKKCKRDPKKIWEKINSWTGRKKANIDNIIKRYFGDTDSMYNICSHFADTFTNEIISIKHYCSVKLLDRSKYVKVSNVTFRFKPVTGYAVCKVIDQLSSDKAPGSDGIRAVDLKTIKDKIAPVLSRFINLCLSKGEYPSPLKKALIRPIYKQGGHSVYANYRPIAILSVVNKIVERIVVGQVSEFLEKNSILADVQHGFRQGRSTMTALSQFTEDMNGSLNSGHQVLAMFIDYKKAFDTLDHEVLLQAMDECGVRGPTNRWFRSYLSGRTLQTVVSGVAGKEAAVQLGVPTGSVYGPVGYVMHVNSVSNVVEKCRVYMYADDMCLMYSSKNIQEARAVLQTDFDNITRWAHDNGIILNLNKTKVMHICSPHNLVAKNVKIEDIGIVGHTYECMHVKNINCGCQKLQYVNKFKYLGLWVDCNMNWKTQVDTVCAGLRAVLSKFYILKAPLSRKTLRVIYFALAESLISYGLNTYGRTFKTYLNSIKSLQIRFMKYLVNPRTKLACKDNYEKLFVACKVLPVHEKVEYLLVLEQYHNEQFKIRVQNKYNTRSVRERKLVLPSVRNYYGKRTNRYLVPTLFNKIDLLRKNNTMCKGTLKNKLKKVLLKTMVAKCANTY